MFPNRCPCMGDLALNKVLRAATHEYSVVDSRTQSVIVSLAFIQIQELWRQSLHREACCDQRDCSPRFSVIPIWHGCDVGELAAVV